MVVECKCFISKNQQNKKLLWNKNGPLNQRAIFLNLNIRYYPAIDVAAGFFLSTQDAFPSSPRFQAAVF
jgi:hypothetical protein